jgi:hypothetical protein
VIVLANSPLGLYSHIDMCFFLRRIDRYALLLPSQSSDQVHI